MASMNSSVLACSYAIGGTGGLELSSKGTSVPYCVGPSSTKLPLIKALSNNLIREEIKEGNNQGRRGALFGLAASALIATTTSSSANANANANANAGVIDDYLERSKANKELNDKKRSATSGANFARAYTVQFGTCKFPENFTGCQDLAKQKKVPFISEDLELECEGKDKYKCGSNVFWKW